MPDALDSTTSAIATRRTWRVAMAEALYGPRGFYRRTTASAHFRTSVHASPLFAGAILALARDVDDMLGRPDPYDVVDVGAGGGELLTAIAAAAPPRWRLTAVDVRAGDPAHVRWSTEVPRCTGLLVANEWLDNVPCDVVELTADGPRLMLDDDTPGPPPDAADLAWLAQWWPLGEIGDRAEVGIPRDRAWAAAVGRLDRGVAVAIDYAHELGDRPPYGTLTGYRDGRQVSPVADGSCDLTAHVALDACAAAAPADSTRLTTQRAALQGLGVGDRRPAYDGEPATYLAALSRAGEAAELLDPAGLGGFGWLVHAVGVPQPPTLENVR